MIKKFLFYFILIILSCNFVFAVPPFIQETVNTNNGIEIKFPGITNIQINQDLKLHFHLYNISDGLPIINVERCDFHLYNYKGSHIYINNYTVFSDNYDIEVFIEGSNFTEEKIYPYIFQCYTNITSGIGGFISTDLVVGGEINERENTWLPIVLCLISMSGLLFFSSNMIKKKELKEIKGLFFLLGIIHTLLIGCIPFLISLNPLNSASFLPVALGYLSVNIITIITFFYLKGFALIQNIFKKIEKED